MLRPFRFLPLLAGLLAIGLVTAACDDSDDDTGNADGTTSSGSATDEATTGDNGSDSAVEDAYNDLKARFDGAPDAVKSQIQSVWDEIESLYTDWRDASADERAAVGGQLTDLFNTLRNQLERLIP